MSNRLRVFMAVPVLLALGACESSRVGSVHIDPSLQALVPANTVFLSGADVVSVRETKFYQRFLNTINPAQLNTFAGETGIDPRKDLDEILTCSDGTNTALLARGRFAQADLEKRLRANGARAALYKGRSLFVIGSAAVWFPAQSMAVAGQEAALHNVIDAQDGARGVPMDLRTQLDSAPAESQVWLAFVGGVHGIAGAVPANTNLANAAQMLRGIDSGSLGLDLRTGLNLEARVNCKTSDDARHIHDALRGLIGMGRLSTPDNQPDMLKMFDAIEVTQTQTAVHVAAKLPQELVDKFLDVWLKRR